jgi:dolichol-phosphate mannosyltransferase
MSSSAKPVPSLSAVMPAYNEEEVLPVSLAEAVEALEEIVEDWELIVVDDGSRDRTPQILAEWIAKEPRIRVLTQTPNQGYSKALIRGFYDARKDTVFYTDADAQFDLREIARLYPHLKDHDMVCGYRVGRKDPPIRFVTSFTFNKLQGLILGTNARDVNCAFKLFRKSFFEKVKLDSDGFLIDAEIYIRAKKAGLTFTQLGVTHRPRTMGSTTVKLKTVTDTLKQLWQLRRSV